MRALLILVVLILLAPGCGRAPQTKENPAADRLRRILLAFDAVAYEKKRGPRDAEEIKPFLKGPSGKDDPNEALRSPNDGEPFVILWGINLETIADINTVVAYEKKGAGGKRYGITAARIVKPIGDAEATDGKTAPGTK